MNNDELNVYLSVNNTTRFVLFINSLDSFYVNNRVLNNYDRLDFINTPRDINYFNPKKLISYYNPDNIQFKYKNLLIDGIYALFPKIINSYSLIDKDEFSICFENDKYISSKSKISPYYFRKEYIDNPNYYYIRVYFKKMYDEVNNQIYFNMNIFYKLNITYMDTNKTISDMIINKINLSKPNYINNIIENIIISLDKNI